MSRLFTADQEADAAPINAQQYDDISIDVSNAEKDFDTAVASANTENDAEPKELKLSFSGDEPTAASKFDTAGANVGQEEPKSGNAATTKKKGMRGFFF